MQGTHNVSATWCGSSKPHGKQGMLSLPTEIGIGN